MKTTAQILLVIFFVLSFFVGLLAATFKFQLLDYNFWTKAFQKNNVYQNLATESKGSFETQISTEGGNKNDVKVLTDLITPDNAKDVVDRNLQNFLSFANGVSPQIKVYLPIDKVPKDLLPKSIAGIKSEMTLQDFLTKFNFQDWQNLPLQSLSHSGESATYFFVGALSLLLLALFFLILLVEEGKRFIGLGIAFILSGGLVFFLSTVGTDLNTALTKSLLEKTSIILIMSGIIFSPVITEIIAVWKILGLVLLVIGIGLFFVKKPRYNNSK